MLTAMPMMTSGVTEDGSTMCNFCMAKVGSQDRLAEGTLLVISRGKCKYCRAHWILQWFAMSWREPKFGQSPLALPS